MPIKIDESSHWYTPAGEPRHDATLKEARDEGLYPSVNNFLDIVSNPFLDKVWRVRKAIETAYELGTAPLPGETIEEFVTSCDLKMRDDQKKILDKGSDAHAWIESYMITKRGKPPTKSLEYAVGFIETAKIKAKSVEEIIVNHIYGYGGTADLVGTWEPGGGERTVLLDWKTQNVKEKSPRYYDKFVWQLAAYNKIVDCDDVVSVIISTNEDRPGCWHKVWKKEQVEWGWKTAMASLALWRQVKKFDYRR